ncbi:FadR/GntR family transcriptional regulator [Robbsia andropogonis]|uniref:FadR/GntR family transcriptional regulator n=1 Tax=Robbsia andropogonis TaxID=28092 RepID=UPI000463A52E|nr:FCD domain-containing protein [Robbsia andropogonis]
MSYRKGSSDERRAWLAEKILLLCDATRALPSQEAIAGKLGVSGTRLHEAMSRLLACGAIKVRTRLGMRVLQEDQWQIVDGDVVRWRLSFDTDGAFRAAIVALRRAFEPIAAGDAAHGATAEDRTRIISACANRMHAKTLGAYVQAHVELHAAVMAASPNRIVRQMACLVSPLYHSTAADNTVPIRVEGDWPALAMLTLAMRDRDPIAAREAMEQINTFDLPHLPSKRCV